MKKLLSLTKAIWTITVAGGYGLIILFGSLTWLLIAGIATCSRLKKG